MFLTHTTHSELFFNLAYKKTFLTNLWSSLTPTVIMHTPVQSFVNSLCKKDIPVNQYKNLCHKGYRLQIKLNFSYSIHNYTIYHLFGNLRQTNKPKDSHILLLGKGEYTYFKSNRFLQIKPCDYMNQSGSCNKSQILLVKNS